MGPIIWIDISLDHQKYKGFSWTFNGMLYYFAFSILVFGLVKRLFLFYWLSMGLKSSFYRKSAGMAGSIISVALAVEPIPLFVQAGRR